MTLDPTLVQGFYIYEYTFLDDLQFIRRPYDAYQNEDTADVTRMIAAIHDRLVDAGWEGDGEIGVFWLPPFVDVGIEDTWGTYVWHVKQNNNGISFLACDHPLRFARLAEQNREYPPRNGRPINIIGTSVNSFQRDVRALSEQVSESLQVMRSLPESTTRDSTIEHLLAHYQGLMVRSYAEFLDDCYLQFLIEVINNGNKSKLTIQKTNVKVDPNRYVPDDDPDYPIGTDGAQWLTVQGLISDIWMSFKFEPYKKKVQMVFSSVQFNLDESVKAELLKHVLLRNCIQHNEGKLDKDSLRQSGLERLTMQHDTSTFHLNAWDRIVFTQTEVTSFASTLYSFATELSNFIDKRIPTRHYLVKRNAEES
ncbi:MAG: hypothetical protein ABL888_19245 [Pirellulaceae bacterium]